MSIIEIINKIEELAVQIPNVNQFKDIDIELLQSDKYSDDPIVLLQLGSAESLGIGNMHRVNATVGVYSLVDENNESLRYVQDITLNIITQLNISLIDNDLLSDEPRIFEEAVLDNGLRGYQMIDVPIIFTIGCNDYAPIGD